MKERYFTVDMEIITFDSEDVITTSGIIDCPNEGDEI